MATTPDVKEEKDALDALELEAKEFDKVNAMANKNATQRQY